MVNRGLVREVLIGFQVCEYGDRSVFVTHVTERDIDLWAGIPSIMTVPVVPV